MTIMVTYGEEEFSLDAVIRAIEILTEDNEDRALLVLRRAEQQVSEEDEEDENE